MASSTQPNVSLYIHNLNDKVNKDELRTQLLALFASYGKLIDIVARKGPKMKGQAFVVFTDLAGATTAMRACEGMSFYGKPLHIEYAKSKSHASLRREDPMFISPSTANVSRLVAIQNAAKLNGSASGKRPRDKDEDEIDVGRIGERQTKREKVSEDDEDGEEMEIEDDEEGGAARAHGSTNGHGSASPHITQQPSARLLCTNLPQEVTDDVLSVLFQQYQGFQTTQVAPSSTPNTFGQTTKMAQVLYDSPELATIAKDALDGFSLKKGWTMSVAYA